MASTPSSSPEPRWLPFSAWAPIFGGAAVGLLMRLLAFSGGPGTRWSAMAAGFILCTPMAAAAVTVHLAERRQRRGWWYYPLAGAAAALLVVAGALALFIEGIICALLIVPLFAALGAAAGLLMGIVCRVTGWSRHAAYGFAALPLLVAMALPGGPGPQRLGEVERSLWINAPAEVVWARVNNVRDIQPAEVGHALAYRIGVPLPLEGVTHETPSGRVRKSRWDKGVHFDEVIHEWEPARHVRWTYRFAPDSVPPGALDDHVAIGGAYFDLRDTAYTLTPEAGGTRLHLRIGYRLSTDFNAYADWWAQTLLDDFAATILNLYRLRSEGVS